MTPTPASETPQPQGETEIEQRAREYWNVAHAAIENPAATITLMAEFAEDELARAAATPAPDAAPASIGDVSHLKANQQFVAAPSAAAQVGALVEAVTKYAFNYMQDEAHDEEDCVCGREQHEAAKAVFAALKPLRAALSALRQPAPPEQA
jgi:hypothetical protein